MTTIKRLQEENRKLSNSLTAATERDSAFLEEESYIEIDLVNKLQGIVERQREHLLVKACAQSPKNERVLLLRLTTEEMCEALHPICWFVPPRSITVCEHTSIFFNKTMREKVGKI